MNYLALILICAFQGWACAAIAFNYYQRGWPDIAALTVECDRAFAIIWGCAMATLPLIGFLLTIFLTGGAKHGASFLLKAEPPK